MIPVREALWKMIDYVIVGQCAPTDKDYREFEDTLANLVKEAYKKGFEDGTSDEDGLGGCVPDDAWTVKKTASLLKG